MGAHKTAMKKNINQEMRLLRRIGRATLNIRKTQNGTHMAAENRRELD